VDRIGDGYPLGDGREKIGGLSSGPGRFADASHPSGDNSTLKETHAMICPF
jgi:hypothetical protein